MQKIDKILSISSDAAFEECALELFEFQSVHCEIYSRYISSLGIYPDKVDTLEKIPFLPIGFFRTHKVYCGKNEPEIVFTSSSTGGGTPSRHFMELKSDYEKTFQKAFSMFYPDHKNMSIYALLPGYMERQGSSLIYMVDNLIKKVKGGGFYLNDYEKLLSDILHDKGDKLLIGVSYALWDFAEKYSVPLLNTIVMETGGMKGKREELTKEEFHTILKDAFGVKEIHSEYGMAELSSQAYSSGKGLFKTPPWMKILIRDINDPFDILPPEKTGGVNIIDLANINSCAFIQTEDLGKLHKDGSFSPLGRIEKSVIRGCNLLVQ